MKSHIESQAAERLRQAAEQGDANAHNDLGILYKKGEGVPQDHEKAAITLLTKIRIGDIL